MGEVVPSSVLVGLAGGSVASVGREAVIVAPGVLSVGEFVAALPPVVTGSKKTLIRAQADRSVVSVQGLAASRTKKPPQL